MGFSSSQTASASLIGQIGGGLTSTAGSFFSAQAQKTALDAQANIDDANARIAELGAQQELYKGQAEVGRLTLQAGQLKSAQRARLAANGADLGEGSAAEIQASTDIMKSIDANTATANAVQSAWGYRTQAVNYQNDALMKRATAQGINPGAQAFGTLLGAAGQVAGSWYRFNKEGAWSSGSSGHTIGMPGGPEYSDLW